MMNEGRAARRRKQRQPEDKEPRSLRQTLVRLGLIVLALAVVAVAIAVPFYIFRDDDQEDAPPVAEVPTFAPPPYQLRLDSAECTDIEGGIQVEGSVTNVSGETLEEVGVVGHFRNPSDEVVASALGLLAESFAPGETLPFTLNVGETGLSGCAVTFELPNGQQLFVDESIIP